MKNVDISYIFLMIIPNLLFFKYIILIISTTNELLQIYFESTTYQCYRIVNWYRVEFGLFELLYVFNI